MRLLPVCRKCSAGPIQGFALFKLESNFGVDEAALSYINAPHDR